MQNADRAQRREPDAEEVTKELVFGGRTGIVHVIWVMKKESQRKSIMGRAYPKGEGTG